MKRGRGVAASFYVGRVEGVQEQAAARQAAAVLELGRQQAAHVRWLLTMCAGLGWPADRLVRLEVLLEELTAELARLAPGSAGLGHDGCGRPPGAAAIEHPPDTGDQAGPMHRSR